MMVQMQHRVVNLISKSPSERRDIEIQVVLPWIRKKSNLFKDLDKAILKDVLRNCAYKKSFKDDVIIAQGEVGDSFYIMLTGKTSVFIDTQNSDEDPPPDEDDPQEEEEKISKSSILSSKETDQKEKKHLDRTKYGKFIIHYEEGKSFGEVALMSEDSVRNATVIADDETDLLVISRELFNRSMKAKQEEEYEERKDFIRRSPYFSNWTIKFKRLLEMSIHKEYFPFGTTIVKQGDPVPGMLFILSGQAKMIMNPAHHKQQFSSLFKRVDPVEAEILRQKQKRHVVREEQEYAQAQIRVRMKEGYAAAERRHRNKEVELCCIEVNDVIGDVEMALELESSISTVVCTANTTVMVLDNKNYDRLVAKKHTHTINKICQRALQKVTFRSKTTQGLQIPLMKRIQEKLKEKLPKPQTATVIRQQVTELDKQRGVLMEQLVEFFLQGKSPMIEPFVPNSLYYRKKSARRAEVIEQLKARKLGLQNGDNVRRPLYEKPRHKVARSLKQLQNANAESELLGPYRQYRSGNSHNGSNFSSAVVQRPVTAVATGNHHRNNESRARPHTAHEGRSRTFLTEYYHDEENSDMFKHMESLQREKQENRSKVICSATARADLDLRSLNGINDISMLYDDDYFDWETSESHLQTLEEKMKNFCSKIETKSYRDAEPRISTLRRFSIKDERDDETHEIKVPKPGGTVFIKTRLCDNHVEADNKEEEHQHVRRFIINRESSSAQEAARMSRPKSAFDMRSRASSTSSTRKRPKTASSRTAVQVA